MQEPLVQALSGGAAQSWVLTNRSGRMLANDYPLGFKVALHRKDLGIALDLAREMGQVAIFWFDGKRFWIIGALVERVDAILIGGAMAFTFIAAEGGEVGDEAGHGPRR